MRLRPLISHVPFVLRNTICMLRGHKWRDDPDVEYTPDNGETWRPAQYCARCYKTKDNKVYLNKLYWDGK